MSGSDTGTRIRMARVELGWDQRQLAEAAGMVQPQISRIERGGNAQLRTVERIELALAQAGASGLGVRHHAGGPLARPAHEPGQLNDVDLAGDVIDVDWLVEGYVARGAVTMLAGQPGAGKSMWCQVLAAAAAGGGPGPGGLEVAPGHVWIVDAENGEPLILRRFAALTTDPEARRRLHIEAAVGFDLEADLALLEERLGADADYLLLDSWTSLWAGSEYWAEAVKACLSGLRGLAQRAGVGVVLIHHTTKGADTYRGTGAIGGIIEGVFTLVRAGQGEGPLRAVECQQMRLAAEPPRLGWNIEQPTVAAELSTTEDEW